MKSLYKGVRVVNGYLQVRIMRKGRVYTKNFGPDSSLARDLACQHAMEKYRDFLRTQAGFMPEAKRIKFAAARAAYFQRHFVEYKDPNTNKPRTAMSISSTKYLLSRLGEFFDGYYLDEITVANVKEYKATRLEKGVSNATFNRERGVLFSIFVQFKAWIAESTIAPVELPATNPCASVPTLTENERNRIPDTWELTDAYSWCQANDAGLWDAIEKALLTALRKQDLIALDGTLTVKGIQQKTGEKFDLPITLDKPVDLINYRKRWDALRIAMGWNKVGTPKHTTWHDLRHWAPTMLGEKGFNTKIIQSYLGHSSEQSSERYTNVRRRALEPAVDVVKREIARIKAK